MKIKKFKVHILKPQSISQTLKNSEFLDWKKAIDSKNLEKKIHWHLLHCQTKKNIALVRGSSK